MRIALVTKRFSEAHGGVERFSVNLARELVRRGHEVHVLAHRWDVEPEGARIRRVSMIPVCSAAKMVSFAFSARRELARESYDVVYALTPALGGDVYRVGGLHRQWMAAKHRSGLSRRFRSFISPVNVANLYLERRIFSAAGYALFVANSAMGKEHIIVHCGTPADSIRVIYNGVDPKTFHPGVRARYREPVRREEGIPADVPVLLFLAANWPRKGLDTFLRALPPDRDFWAVVVGRGNVQRYAGLAARSKRKGSLFFAAATREPARFYGMADLFVLPTRYDPFANVCLEAMACGLPVITTRENGAAELIEPGVNGYLMDRADDAPELRGLLVEFLGRGDWEAMRRAAAETASRYPAERTAEETIRLFEEVVAVKRARGPDDRAAAFRALTAQLAAGNLPPGWSEVRHSRPARVLRGVLPDGRAAVYKEFLPGGPWDSWKGLFRGTRARRAQRGSAMLRARGFSAPRTLAVGNLSGGRSFLLAEALPGETLEDCYRKRFGGVLDGESLARKRDLIRGLGRAVACLHRRGVIHGDLRGYNILVEEAGGGWRFHFLDNERTTLSWSEAKRYRNLVQLATIALPGLTVRDRMRFFGAYRSGRTGLAGEWKELARRVHAAGMRRLRKRGLVP